jgi:hypothetical protein
MTMLNMLKILGLESMAPVEFATREDCNFVHQRHCHVQYLFFSGQQAKIYLTS